MKIASWNVNSIKARLDAVIAWVTQAQPDVVGFQEIKCVDEAFPRGAFEDLGYNVHTHGQKTYNGVALLSKHPFEEARKGLNAFEDEQARFVEAVILPKNERPVRFCNLYLPNGNPVNSPKYPYKLKWMAALEAHVRELLPLEERLVVAGDYNVIPAPDDCFNPLAWEGDALFRPETRDAYRRFVNLGLTDAIRACNALPRQYTFWDYQAGAWQKNNGIRIDHMLLSPLAADSLAEAGIDKHVRSWDKTSDHVPVWCVLKD